MSSTPLLIRIIGDNREFRAALASSGADLNTFQGKLSQVSSSLASIGTSMSVGITLPVVAAGSAVLKAAADMDSLKRALLSTAGSAEEAEKQFGRLQQIAKLPGIGLEEAVRGSIRLQNYGLSVGQAEKALRGFSNAVASAGGKAEDTQEALRQLGQIFGRQTVTMDNLRIVLERVPQAAKIIRENFGAEALADPAKTFERLGISSAQFVDILVNKMAELPPVSVGIKTAMENLRQEVTIAAARIGDVMVPAVIALIPKLEQLAIGTADLVVGFSKLPPEITNTALALSGLLLAAGPIAATVGRIVAVFGELKLVLGTVGTAIGGLFGTAVIASIGQTLTAIDQLKARYKDLRDEQERRRTGKEDLIVYPADKPDAQGVARRAGIDIAALSKELGILQVGQRQVADATNTATSSIETQNAALKQHSFRLQSAQRETLGTALLKERLKILEAEQSKAIHDTAVVMNQFGAVTIEQTRLALGAADAVNQWTLAMYGLAGAPDAAIPAITMKQMPRVTGISDLPRAVNLPDNVSNRNVGPTGMMTKGQFDQIAQAAKNARKSASETMRQISTIITDAGRSISRSLTDLIFVRPRVDLSKYQDDIAELTAEQAKLLEQQRRGQNVAAALEANTRKLAEANRKMAEEVKKASLGFRALEAAKSIVADVAQSIIRVLIEGALKRLAGSLASLGGLFGTVFGGFGGGAASAAGGAASAAGSVGASAAGSVGSAAGSSITGIVGAVSGVVSAISGVFSNFQFAAMNKSLDLIEKEVRYSQIHLLHLLEKANEFWPNSKNIWDSLLRMEERQMGLAGGSSMTFNFAAGSLSGGVSQSQVEGAFKLAVEKFKRQGIN